MNEFINNDNNLYDFVNNYFIDSDHTVYKQNDEIRYDLVKYNDNKIVYYERNIYK